MDQPEPRITRGINKIQDLPVGESVEFNQFGQAIGKWQHLYGKYLGTRTRRLIPILTKNWKAVKQEEKDFLWNEIKTHFRLENLQNDEVKKRTLVSCGTKWKAFKTKLRVKFMLKNVSPLIKWTHIQPAVWDEFCRNENTPEKNKLRAQAIERSKKPISRSRLGPKGYRGFEKQWQEERSDPEKATELHLIPDIRSSNYCLARAPHDEKGNKKMTPELIDASKNLVQATKDLAQGSMEAKTGVDPLIVVFGPEHGGRTRGVGCDVGYKKGIDGYVKKKKARKNTEDIRNEVREQLKEELKSTEFWLEMRASMKEEARTELLHESSISTRQETVPSLVHKRSNLTPTTNRIREGQNSEQNESGSTRHVNVPDSFHKRSTTSNLPLRNIKEETYCCLYVPSSIVSQKPVVCATATLFPIFGNDMVHFKKLRNGHMKVSVIKVVGPYNNMALPVAEEEIPDLQSAVNGFIQWPLPAIGRYTGSKPPPVVPSKRLRPQQENTPSIEKVKEYETPTYPKKIDKAREETPKQQKAMQNDAVIDQTQQKKDADRNKLRDLENDILTNRPQNVIDGYNRWMSREDYVAPYNITVNKKIFRQANESYFAINATDIIELLSNDELEWGVLTLFAMSLYHIKGQSSGNKVGFLNPGIITADSCFHDKWATIDYLTLSLTGHDYYLAPYLQGRHYVLFIICPKHGMGFILNPLKESSTNEQHYKLVGLVESVIGSLKWDFPVVNRQPSDRECGYYVMKWMHEFFLKYQQNEDFPKRVPWNDERSLDNKEMNAIVGTWFTLWRD